MKSALPNHIRLLLSVTFQQSMHVARYLFVVLCLFLFGAPVTAQDSCGLRISLLTCAPGTELYSIFGHTAIRVQDAAGNTDEVYNYGTFAFDDPDFYIKFVRGKLPYSLSVASMQEFAYEYTMEGRSIREQVLLVDCSARQRLWMSLRENARPENREYKYDFIFDNCTTRAADMIARAAPQPVRRNHVIPDNPKQAPSFRQLIHQYLDRGQQPWSKLGIDLLLGAKLDRKSTNDEAQFLPEKLLEGINGATAAGKPLAEHDKGLLTMPAQKAEKTFATPFVVFSSLLVLILVLSFVPGRGMRRFFIVFDFLLFFITGLAGLLLLFMWFGTDHALCANNWNLLWALPTHFIAAPFLRRPGKKMHWYLLFTMGLLALVVLGWIFLPQQLNIGLLPILLLLLLRSWLIILKPHEA
jgi:hypothetical protein